MAQKAQDLLKVKRKAACCAGLLLIDHLMLYQFPEEECQRKQDTFQNIEVLHKKRPL